VDLEVVHEAEDQGHRATILPLENVSMSNASIILSFAQSHPPGVLNSVSAMEDFILSPQHVQDAFSEAARNAGAIY